MPLPSRKGVLLRRCEFKSPRAGSLYAKRELWKERCNTITSLCYLFFSTAQPDENIWEHQAVCQANGKHVAHKFLYNLAVSWVFSYSPVSTKRLWSNTLTRTKTVFHVNRGTQGTSLSETQTGKDFSPCQSSVETEQRLWEWNFILAIWWDK